MATVIRRNERSWAIELISKINSFVAHKDLKIKKAGGESTVSIRQGNTMFPDVILYGNAEQSLILQGWELKMPDVSIEDEIFIKDAQRKAVALNLNSCVIWNFTYAVLYIRQADGTFIKEKQWNDTKHIKSRDDVGFYRSDWEELLEKILLEINQYFLMGKFSNSTIGEVISTSTITTIIQRNKLLVSETLKEQSYRNSVIVAHINNWWSGIKNEYEGDENDKYAAYSKSIILNWANRVLFAHIIKRHHNIAMLIDSLDYKSTPSEANDIFKAITKKCDFYNVFSAIRFDEILPVEAWNDIIDFSMFLKENGIVEMDQAAFQNILEGTVNTAKRTINGQYTTPHELAKILSKITIHDWVDNVIDCCCGTGTIPNIILKEKKEMLSVEDAVKTVWACDKYSFPLQIANISMTSYDTIDLPNMVFQHNALSLCVGEKVQITNPSTGKFEQYELPAFGAVVSNLPFVEQEIIPADDEDKFSRIRHMEELDGRSDLYCYIALKMADIIKPYGYLGMITSNSWLGTTAGKKLISALQKEFYLRQVHISGKGRWFTNADVVTTLTVLQRKSTKEKSCSVGFYLWQRSLDEIKNDPNAEDTLVNSAILEKELDSSVTKLSIYSNETVNALINMNLSYNALFHNVSWLLDIKDKFIAIDKVYHVFRGSRRGWDKLFYPTKGKHHIEQQFLRKVLLNAHGIHRLDASADGDAFCCGLPMEELKSKKYYGAIEWIKKFEDGFTNVGIPLPIALKKKDHQWYELKENEIADVFTMMNPDKRFFFGKFKTPSFINQRLIGLRKRPEYPDSDLNHALLNSICTFFFIEASGFGRGLGVLDINKTILSKCYMPKPSLVSEKNRELILKAFDNLKQRDIMNLSDELEDPLRIEFEHTVLKAFGIESYYERIVSSIVSMHNARAAVNH